MINLYLFLSAVAVTVLLGLAFVHFVMNFFDNSNMYQEQCEHGNKIISQCPKCHFGYDFQEDIANYNNDYNDYDYDKDCNINKYEYDIGAEAELSQEWIANHTEEKDKN